MVNIALYDLDNTLYPFSSGVMDAINERISVFVEQRLQVERAQALVLRSTELMRASDAVLAKEWRRLVGNIGTQLEGTAAQVRSEVARIAARPPQGEGSRPTDHESG